MAEHELENLSDNVPGESSSSSVSENKHLTVNNEQSSVAVGEGPNADTGNSVISGLKESRSIAALMNIVTDGNSSEEDITSAKDAIKAINELEKKEAEEKKAAIVKEIDAFIEAHDSDGLIDYEAKLKGNDEEIAQYIKDALKKIGVWKKEVAPLLDKIEHARNVYDLEGLRDYVDHKEPAVSEKAQKARDEIAALIMEIKQNIDSIVKEANIQMLNEIDTHGLKELEIYIIKTRSGYEERVTSEKKKIYDAKATGNVAAVTKSMKSAMPEVAEYAKTTVATIKKEIESAKAEIDDLMAVGDNDAISAYEKSVYSDVANCAKKAKEEVLKINGDATDAIGKGIAAKDFDALKELAKHAYGVISTAAKAAIEILHKEKKEQLEKIKAFEKENKYFEIGQLRSSLFSDVAHRAAQVYEKGYQALSQEALQQGELKLRQAAVAQLVKLRDEKVVGVLTTLMKQEVTGDHDLMIYAMDKRDELMKLLAENDGAGKTKGDAGGKTYFIAWPITVVGILGILGTESAKAFWIGAAIIAAAGLAYYLIKKWQSVKRTARPALYATLGVIFVGMSVALVSCEKEPIGPDVDPTEEVIEVPSTDGLVPSDFEVLSSLDVSQVDGVEFIDNGILQVTFADGIKEIFIPFKDSIYLTHEYDSCVFEYYSYDEYFRAYLKVLNKQDESILGGHTILSPYADDSWVKYGCWIRPPTIMNTALKGILIGREYLNNDDGKNVYYVNSIGFNKIKSAPSVPQGMRLGDENLLRKWIPNYPVFMSNGLTRVAIGVPYIYGAFDERFSILYRGDVIGLSLRYWRGSRGQTRYATLLTGGETGDEVADSYFERKAHYQEDFPTLRWDTLNLSLDHNDPLAFDYLYLEWRDNWSWLNAENDIYLADAWISYMEMPKKPDYMKAEELASNWDVESVGSDIEYIVSDDGLIKITALDPNAIGEVIVHFPEVYRDGELYKVYANLKSSPYIYAESTYGCSMQVSMLSDGETVGYSQATGGWDQYSDDKWEKRLLGYVSKDQINGIKISDFKGTVVIGDIWLENADGDRLPFFKDSSSSGRKSDSGSGTLNSHAWPIAMVGILGILATESLKAFWIGAGIIAAAGLALFLISKWQSVKRTVRPAVLATLGIITIGAAVALVSCEDPFEDIKPDTEIVEDLEDLPPIQGNYGNNVLESWEPSESHGASYEMIGNNVFKIAPDEPKRSSYNYVMGALKTQFPADLNHTKAKILVYAKDSTKFNIALGHDTTGVNNNIVYTYVNIEGKDAWQEIDVDIDPAHSWNFADHPYIKFAKISYVESTIFIGGIYLGQNVIELPALNNVNENNIVPYVDTEGDGFITRYEDVLLVYKTAVVDLLQPVSIPVDYTHVKLQVYIPETEEDSVYFQMRLKDGEPEKEISPPRSAKYGHKNEWQEIILPLKGDIEDRGAGVNPIGYTDYTGIQLSVGPGADEAYIGEISFINPYAPPVPSIIREDNILDGWTPDAPIKMQNGLYRIIGGGENHFNVKGPLASPIKYRGDLLAIYMRYWMDERGHSRKFALRTGGEEGQEFASVGGSDKRIYSDQYPEWDTLMLRHRPLSITDPEGVGDLDYFEALFDLNWQWVSKESDIYLADMWVEYANVVPSKPVDMKESALASHWSVASVGNDLEYIKTDNGLIKLTSLAYAPKGKVVATFPSVKVPRGETPYTHLRMRAIGPSVFQDNYCSIVFKNGEEVVFEGAIGHSYNRIRNEWTECPIEEFYQSSISSDIVFDNIEIYDMHGSMYLGDIYFENNGKILGSMFDFTSDRSDARKSSSSSGTLYSVAVVPIIVMLSHFFSNTPLLALLTIVGLIAGILYLLVKKLRISPRLVSLFGVLTALGLLSSNARAQNVDNQRYFEQGKRLYQTGSYQRAIEQFEKIDPKTDSAHIYLARAQLALGDSISAADNYIYSLRLNRRLEEPYTGLADIHLKHWKSLDYVYNDYKALLDLNPKSLVNINIYAMYGAFLQKEKLDELEEFLTARLKSMKTEAELYLALGLLTAGTDREEAAQYYFERALKLERADISDVNRKYIYLYNGLMLYFTDQQAAFNYLSKAIELDDSLQDAHRMAGLILKENGYYDEALKYLNRAVAIDARYANYIELADCYREYKNYDKALEIYKYIYSEIEGLGMPERSKISFGIALTYFDQGQDKKALIYADRAIQQFIHNYDALKLAGLINIRLKNYVKSIEYYENLLKVSPGDATGKRYLVFLYPAVNEGSKATAIYNSYSSAELQKEMDMRSLYASFKLGVDYKRLLDFWWDGQIAVEFGSPEEAVKAFEAGLRIDPGSFSFHRVLAENYSKLGNTDKAISHGWKALYLDSNAKGLYGILANAYLAEGNADEALRVADGASLNEDMKVWAEVVRGLAYLQKKLYELADASFMSATRMAPNDPTLYFDIARNYYIAGMYEKAYSYVTKAVQLAPSFQNAQELLEQLKKENPGIFKAVSWPVAVVGIVSILAGEYGKNILGWATVAVAVILLLGILFKIYKIKYRIWLHGKNDFNLHRVLTSGYFTERAIDTIGKNGYWHILVNAVNNPRISLRIREASAQKLLESQEHDYDLRSVFTYNLFRKALMNNEFTLALKFVIARPDKKTHWMKELNQAKVEHRKKLNEAFQDRSSRSELDPRISHTIYGQRLSNTSKRYVGDWPDLDEMDQMEVEAGTKDHMLEVKIDTAKESGPIFRKYGSISINGVNYEYFIDPELTHLADYRDGKIYVSPYALKNDIVRDNAVLHEVIHNKLDDKGYSGLLQDLIAGTIEMRSYVITSFRRDYFRADGKQEIGRTLQETVDFIYNDKAIVFQPLKRILNQFRFVSGSSLEQQIKVVAQFAAMRHGIDVSGMNADDVLKKLELNIDDIKIVVDRLENELLGGSLTEELARFNDLILSRAAQETKALVADKEACERVVILDGAAELDVELVKEVVDNKKRFLYIVDRSEGETTLLPIRVDNGILSYDIEKKIEVKDLNDAVKIFKAEGNNVSVISPNNRELAKIDGKDALLFTTKNLKEGALKEVPFEMMILPYAFKFNPEEFEANKRLHGINKLFVKHGKFVHVNLDYILNNLGTSMSAAFEHIMQALSEAMQVKMAQNMVKIAA
ncbi:MAG: tetratricopeptide repeat protein [Candidatus Omnitrophica bacterium]|nr:tetratricopeptide repeat protein [Candidatus Omnitrophota bacterium]